MEASNATFYGECPKTGGDFGPLRGVMEMIFMRHEMAPVEPADFRHWPQKVETMAKRRNPPLSHFAQSPKQAV